MRSQAYNVVASEGALHLASHGANRDEGEEHFLEEKEGRETERQEERQKGGKKEIVQNDKISLHYSELHISTSQPKRNQVMPAPRARGAPARQQIWNEMIHSSIGRMDHLVPDHLLVLTKVANPVLTCFASEE